MSKVFLLCMVMVGIINFLPVLGVLSAERIVGAYDVEVSGNDMEILLRHRALLFGIVFLAGAIAIKYFVAAGDSA